MASDIKIIEGDIWKGCYFIFFNSPRTKKNAFKWPYSHFFPRIINYFSWIL